MVKTSVTCRHCLPQKAEKKTKKDVLKRVHLYYWIDYLLIRLHGLF